MLFKASPNAMWIFDTASQRVIAVNQAAANFYGIRKSTFLALQMGALFPDGSGAALFSAVRCAGAANVALQICRQVKGDGEVVLVELVLQMSDNGAGFDTTYTDKLAPAFQSLGRKLR